MTICDDAYLKATLRIRSVVNVIDKHQSTKSSSTNCRLHRPSAIPGIAQDLSLHVGSQYGTSVTPLATTAIARDTRNRILVGSRSDSTDSRVVGSGFHQAAGSFIPVSSPDDRSQVEGGTAIEIRDLVGLRRDALTATLDEDVGEDLTPVAAEPLDHGSSSRVREAAALTSIVRSLSTSFSLCRHQLWIRRRIPYDP